jgi:hypothetical protein
MMIRFMSMACLLSLAACSTLGLDGEKDTRRCPQMAAVKDLSLYKDFGREDVEDDTTLVGEARIDDVKGTCRYRGDRVYVEMGILLSAEKGPRLGGNRFSAPFFVAIANEEDQVLKKDLTVGRFEFQDDNDRAELVETYSLTIPLPDDMATAENYRIVAGFQLPEKQRP